MDDSLRTSPVFLSFAEAMKRAGHLPARTVIALSGGLDSVVLTRLAAAWADVPLAAAHVNHGLRGADADGDAEFCRELCAALGIAFHELRADAAGAAAREGVGLEEAGRRIRYRFFRELTGDCGLVLAGHHADDQVETILLNLRRGAHARGLSGMRENGLATVPPDVSVRVVRPLLAVRKIELEALARRHGWRWREDATNAGVDFTRNRIRNRIVPALEKLVPGFSERLLRRAVEMRALDDRQTERARDFLKTAVHREPNGLFMELTPDTELLSYALRQVVEDETRARIAGGRTLSLLVRLAESGRLNETLSVAGGLYVRRERGGLFFFKEAEMPDETGVQLPAPPFSVKVRGMTVTAEWVPDQQPMPESDMRDPAVQWLNAESVCFPLCLRAPEPGERFRALGAPGSRKIHDLLIDMKVPRRHRGALRVLADAEGALWVWPFRSAERARLEDRRGPALRVRIEEADAR